MQSENFNIFTKLTEKIHINNSDLPSFLAIVFMLIFMNNYKY